MASLPRRLLEGFVAINIAACERIERCLPRRFTRSLLYLHELTVARHMNAAPARHVLDIGGGHLCPFAGHRRPGLGTRITALDILPDQLRRNLAADLRVAADATRILPLADASADLVVTRSVLEHLPDIATFHRESFRVLRPGGVAIHVFPGRFAPFAVLNRLLPNRLTQRLINTAFPQWRDQCGFRAFYRDCHHPAMLRHLRRTGFDIAEIHYRYYQSIYYKVFVPFYLVSVLYDLVLWLIRAKPLASQILVVARKPPATGSAC